MRNTFSETLYNCAIENKKIVIVVADISPAGSMVDFRNKFPNRFINVGVAEQVMVGMAAGMAISGFKPFIYTIATFSLYRPFEMIRDDLAYQNLSVTIVGMGAGVVYSTLGGTHHTMEDIAVAGSMPNMQIISPCDPLEVIEATKHCATQDNGPIYLRLAKAGEPILTDQALEKFRFGKIRYISKGSELCIISHGGIMRYAKQVKEIIEKERGISVSLVSCHTLKPIDKSGISRLLDEHQTIIAIEEHVETGGMCSILKQIAFDKKSKTNILSFNLKDKFIHCYGSYEDILNAHGLSVKKIVKKYYSYTD